jgi:UDP-N-acetylglucosamine--N-acetylmuramyl-(pentapeptide) pyrophosphoryl-undecaprenol N-acetylglucosamine transferase
MSLRVIISGGGTGGHIFPAIAIAKAILRERPDAEILFVGAEGRMEMEKVPQAGFKIIGLPIMGIQRRLTLQNLKVPFKIIASIIKARKIIRDFKPDIAIGVGGYASGPLLRTASSMGVKTLIQEQNSYPGITNKILSKKAEKICVAYDNLEAFFPKEKIVLTGNPVRDEVTQIQNKKVEAFNHFDLNSDKPVLLVIGGSLGALTINRAIEKFAESLTASGLQIIWQTGKNFKSERAHALPGVHAHTFIKEMDYAYAAADIIVSRAGAMSISELCLVKKPCILVPSPNVSEDHQTKNAMALVNKGAAVLVKDSEAINDLENAILELKTNQDLCTTMSKNIAELGHPEADRLIASLVFKICGK